MSDAKTEIDEALGDFIRKQQIFFVATAPRADGGHINLSPKGLDSFRILSPQRVAWADYVGSGVETVAHLKENGRIVVMFCAFEGKPGIVRIHGIGRAIEPSSSDFSEAVAVFGSDVGVRSVIEIDVQRVARTCGFGVPLMSYDGQREDLPRWCDNKGPDRLLDYQRKKNTESLDGLTGVEL